MLFAVATVVQLSVGSDSARPRTTARQAPLSMGFSQQEYWGGLPSPSPGDLPRPGMQSVSPASAGLSTTTPPGKPSLYNTVQESPQKHHHCRRCTRVTMHTRHMNEHVIGGGNAHSHLRKFAAWRRLTVSLKLQLFSLFIVCTTNFPTRWNISPEDSRNLACVIYSKSPTYGRILFWKYIRKSACLGKSSKVSLGT